MAWYHWMDWGSRIVRCATTDYGPTPGARWEPEIRFLEEHGYTDHDLIKMSHADLLETLEFARWEIQYRHERNDAIKAKYLLSRY